MPLLAFRWTKIALSGEPRVQTLRPRSSENRPISDAVLLLRAYSKLVRFERLMRGGFAKLRIEVDACRRAGISPGPHSIDRVCHAVDMACIWYWKEVLCLQRSAVTVCLLRSFGVPAQMIVGVQQVPFVAHAWVEVNGKVVSDKPYMRDLYTVLDLC